MAVSTKFPNVPTPGSQVDGTPTIGAGHPAPVQAPPKTTGLAATASNSATGHTQPSNLTPKKKDGQS